MQLLLKLREAERFSAEIRLCSTAQLRGYNEAYITELHKGEDYNFEAVDESEIPALCINC